MPLYQCIGSIILLQSTEKCSIMGFEGGGIMSKSLILIPAYNEAGIICDVLDEIKGLIKDIDILVIDDGSTDNTSYLASKKGALVIKLPYNIGYGGALQTGFKYAVGNSYEYIIQFDGDGQHDPNNIREILAILEEKSYDIVIGSRFLSTSYKSGFMKMIAIKLFRLIIKLSTGTKITDPTSGLQGLTRKVFSYYAMMGNYPIDFPDADILITMLRFNYRIKEIPANIRKRQCGKSMHSGMKPLFYFMKIMLSIFIVLIRMKIADGGK